MWQAIGLVAGGFTAIAFVVAAVTAVLLRGLTLRYKALDGVKDPSVRLEMLQTILGRDPSTIAVANAPVEDRLRLLEKQFDHKHSRFKWTVIVASIAFVFLLAGIVVLAIWSKSGADQPQKEQVAAKETERKEPPPKMVRWEDIIPTADNDPASLARLDNYGGTALIHKGGDKYESGDVHVIIGGAQPGDPEQIYPAISFDLAKTTRSNGIRLNAVRLTYSVQVRNTSIITQSISANFRPPITYLATLAKSKTTTTGFLKIEGELRDGLIRFTEAEPLAKCRVEFAGDPGIYKVDMEVEVQEDRGEKKQLLHSPKSVFVAIPDPKDRK